MSAMDQGWWLLLLKRKLFHTDCALAVSILKPCVFSTKLVVGSIFSFICLLSATEIATDEVMVGKKWTLGLH